MSKHSETQEEAMADNKHVSYNQNLVETIVHIVGDKQAIAEVVRLVAYIRYAIKNNLRKQITVNIGDNIANSEFEFDVNGLEVSDYIAQDVISIN